MTTMVTVTINDREISVKAGITILQAAREADIYIPTLCDHPAVLPAGACRICVVEVLGQRNLQSSCTFPVTDGMKIETESKRVISARKLVLEMIFSERNHFCPYCEMSGNCELQDMGYRYRLDHWAFPTYHEGLSAGCYAQVLPDGSQPVYSVRKMHSCLQRACCQSHAGTRTAWKQEPRRGRRKCPARRIILHLLRNLCPGLSRRGPFFTKGAPLWGETP